MTTNDKGDIAVSMVIADLTSKGVKVALPISAHLPFDLVAISENYELSRVSIKYSSGKDSVFLSTRTISVSSKEIVRRVNLDNIDSYAVYSPSTNEVYYVNKKHLEGKVSGLTLRLTDSRKDERIQYAKDFKNVNNLWRVNSSRTDTIC